MNAKCLVCEHSVHEKTFTAKEIVTGRGDEFDYFVCGRCGSTQIVESPDDLAEYYSNNYYSFASPKPRGSFIRRLVDSARTDAALGQSSLVGSLANLVSKPMKYIEWIKAAGLTKKSRILDVGSGSGSVVYKMSLGGFDVTGIDPFVEGDTNLPTGAKVLKCDIHELARRGEDTFDFIMFHHSLEHAFDPFEQLHAAGRILNKGGAILVRVPVSGGYSQQKYWEHWYHLHPPLHIFVPSVQGMKILAERAGYCISKQWFETEASHIANCELILRGISIGSKKGSFSHFTRKELDDFQHIAKVIDETGQGDQSAFLLIRENE